MPSKSKTLSNASDEVILEALISRADALRPSVSQQMKADWLLEGEQGSPIWITKNGGKERFSNGQWRNTMDVNFDLVLPDGTNLLSPVNERLLNLIQAWSFALRQGVLQTIQGPQTWKSSTTWAMRFMWWIKNNDEELFFDERGFENLNEDIISYFFEQLSRDSWAEIFDATGQIAGHLFRLANISDEAVKNIALNNLPVSIIENITAAIRTNDGYRTFYGAEKTELVSRSWLASITHIPESVLNRSFRISTFLRQFEPTLTHPTLLLTFQRHTLFPSQNCPLLSECLTNHASHHTYISHMQRLTFLLANISKVQASIGAPPALDIQKLAQPFVSSTKARAHHNLMPIGTGLYLLDKAMKWILQYGDYIVNVCISFTERSERYRNSNSYKEDSFYFRSNKLNAALDAACAEFSDDYYQAYKELPITHRNTKNGHRNVPTSLKRLLHALLGAAAYLLAFLKPSRYQEVRELPRKCIFTATLFDSTEVSYWLRHSLGKSGKLGHNQQAESPIPEIAARTVRLLQKLGNETGRIFGITPSSSDKLFYLPIGLQWGLPEKDANTNSVNIYLDIFCDVVGSPIDEHGRRWYARTHELRKLFIITLYWHGSLSSLEAARFIAGHSSTLHTAEYIVTDIMGDEISQIEAEYIDDRLIKFESGLINKKENPGLSALYSKVCENFNVDHIESVPEKEYFRYLTDLKSSGAYSIKPVLVSSHSGDTIDQYEIAVIFGEHHDKIN